MTLQIATRRALLFPDSLWLHGGTWMLGDSGWVNTPILGGELFANTGFDADTDWTKGTGWTISGGVGVHAPGSASAITQAVTSVGIWYRIEWTLVTIAAATFTVRFGSAAGDSPAARSVAATYIDTGRSTGTGSGIRALGTLSDGTIDNVSGKALTLNQLFIVRRGNIVTCKPNVVIGTQAGFIVKLDSITNPLNGIIGFLDGVNAQLLKLVNGVYTSLISTAVAPVANGILMPVQVDADTWQLWYNGIQRGTNQSITDASIKAGSFAGAFSTYSGNVLADVIVN